MPTYAYRGNECPHQFEAYQSFSEDPLTECTECGLPVRRVIQLPGIVFKGSGWYITDSRSGGDKSPTANKAATEPASGSNGSSDTKSGETSKTAAETTTSTPAASTVTATKD